MALDRLRGMLMGGAVGDALGAPHEFMSQRHVPYTGYLTERAKITTRWQGSFELALGQITDDQEMTIILARRLLADGQYDREAVLMDYLQWAQGTRMLGHNTRTLFKGVTTIPGYNNRYAKHFLCPQEEWTQSNGALMRCAPLALLNDNQPVLEDAKLTNPHVVTLDVNLVYVSAVRFALQGHPATHIFEWCSQLAQTEAVKGIFKEIRQGSPRHIQSQKGWALHAFWCAFTVLTKFTDFSAAMDWVIGQRGDTDTNAHIAGALLGAVLGYNQIAREPKTLHNINVVMACQSDRPKEYTMAEFDTLCASLAQKFL